MKITRYQLIEVLPFVLTVGLLILVRQFSSECVRGSACLENLFLISSLIGSVGSFAVYKWFKQIGLYQFNEYKWTKIRLILAIISWGGGLPCYLSKNFKILVIPLGS